MVSYFEFFLTLAYTNSEKLLTFIIIYIDYHLGLAWQHFSMSFVLPYWSEEALPI